MSTHLTRRTAFTGIAGLGVGAVALTACGSDDTDAASDPASDAASPSESSSEAPAETGAAAGALAATSDIPVGGCVVFPDQKCVVTQAAEGEFKAFSSVCTHQGCTVSASTDGVIPCECHGSEFSLEDGSVLAGPAGSSLDEVAITVDGDSITLA